MVKEKKPFKTPYGERERYTLPTGNGMEDIWEYQVNNFGRKVLVKTGEHNLYEEIQASLEETKIENVLARAAAGENVFRPEGIYADVTQMPSNLIEARQAIQNLENTWNSVPNEIKRKYNNSLEDFIAASGTEEWSRDMGLLPTETKELNYGADKTPVAQPFGEVSTKPVTAGGGEATNE